MFLHSSVLDGLESALSYLILESPLKNLIGLALVAHTCNPSYWETATRRTAIQASLGKKVHETPISTEKSWGGGTCLLPQ
jgi:hypothetical protein